MGRLFVFRDVTRERELARLKDEFVSLASHELRSPLTSISGYVDLLLESDLQRLDEEQQDFLAVVKRNVDRLLRLVNELLDLSRIEAGRIDIRRAPTNASAIIQQAVTLIKPQATAKGQTLLFTPPVGLPNASCDPERLAQIMANLLSNAHKYTPAGGTITVTIQAQDGAIRTSVEDTGIGLSPQEQSELFTRFFRANNAATREARGTGLGLTITKTLVELHGGQMSVTSSPGRGSTFSFTLPVTK